MSQNFPLFSINQNHLMCYRRYIQYQNISVAVTSLIISVMDMNEMSD